ncbi:Mor transcription activator family protein [Niveibacterium sp. SC-1]|uniref:Mor transcription activator family protein n=1 Tax=Niveibacterium sp. SC-1 TaxID=3135646 RepID=UPI00311FF3E9
MTAQIDRSIRLLSILTSALRDEMGMPEQDAARLGEQLVRHMSTRVGGAEVYCPKRLEVDRAQRDAAILRDFTGRNLAEVCRRYGVSKTTVYRVVGERPRQGEAA